MNKTNTYLLLLYTLILPALAIAGNGNTVGTDHKSELKINQWLKESGGLRFFENKGQMADLEHRSSGNLLFKASAGGMDIYVTTSGLSYVFTRRSEQDGIQYERADMELTGADIRRENIVKENESSDYNNYYLPQCPDGALHVHSYQRIVVKNIYAGIDWVLYTSIASGKEAITYDFVVHPGADPSLIKLIYKGAKPDLQSDGTLKINASFGTIEEGAPASYAGNEKTEIPTHYLVQDNEITFAITKYDSKNILLIDPSLVWATYFGGSGTDEGACITSDGSHVWVTGSTTSTNFPTLTPSGAYSQASGGGKDAFILCFSTSGVLEWATYYGGSGTDAGVSISVHDSSVWVLGYTISDDLPTYNPGGSYNYYQTATTVVNTSGGTPASGSWISVPSQSLECMFILQFDTSGVRKYATYYGGAFDSGGGDYPNSIYDDGTHIWITGGSSIDNSGNSTYPRVAPPGYYTKGYAGGTSTVITEFTAGGSRIWSTYIGTSFDNAGSGIYSDGVHVWITGKTEGGEPVTNPGGGAYYKGAFNGGSNDAFMLEFDTAGVIIWCTYFGGSANDRGQSISGDGTYIWVTGYTTSANFPIQNLGAAYNQASLAGTENAFIAKFNTSGVLLWSTYYGGSGTDLGNSINSDGTNVWVTGYTKSSDFPTKVASGCGNAYNQDTLAGTQNAFILQFDTAGIPQWATYYGGGLTDAGNSIYSDGTNIWLTGYATSTNFPIQNFWGAYNHDTLGGTQNAFILNFSNATSLILSVNPPTPALCFGDSVSLTASGAANYTWLPDSGLNCTSCPNPSAKPASTTTYTVTATSGGCTSTATAIITVNQLPAVNAGSVVNICPNDSAQLNVTGPPPGSTYIWSPSANLSCDTCPNPIANPIVTATYTVAATTQAGCSSQDTISVIVTPLSAVAGPDTAVCAGSFVQLYATGGTNYEWSPSTNLSDTTSANPFAIPLAPTTYTVTVSSGYCNATSTVSINTYSTPSPPVINQAHDTLFCSTNPNYVSYQWYNDSAMIAGATDTFYVANSSGNYNVKVTNANGCSIAVGINVILSGIPPLASGDGSGIKLLPNPATDLLMVYGLQYMVGGITIELYNVLGEKVYSLQLETRNSKLQTIIDVSSFAKGVYFMQVSSETGKCVRKFIKK